VVFELSPPAHGSTWSYKILYRFKGGFDAEVPEGNLLLHNGELFGSSSIGNPTDGNYGTVFRLTPPTPGESEWTETVLFTFNGTDGQGPADITFHGGTIYGTAGGGTSGWGVVFELKPISSHWVETVLYNFAGGTDGGGPTNVVFGKDGTMYGATSDGGQPGVIGKPWGVIFSLAYNSFLQYWQESVLYDFTGGSDGGTPSSPVIEDSSGNLYGTTIAGGNTSTCSDVPPFDGCGVVFEFAPSTATETVVYAFNGPPSDGAVPDAVILEPHDILFGSTLQGGSGTCTSFGETTGCGTVFEIKP
jgi:hypothetical protein